MNMYQSYGINAPYTGNYTIVRWGGDDKTRFNYTIEATNSGADYYFITQKTDFTWQQFYEQATKNGATIWVSLYTSISKSQSMSMYP